MTEELKQIIKDAKSTYFFKVNLMCDGKKVTIDKHLSGECSMRYGIYIEGQIKGEWFVSDSDENRAMVKKYYPPKTRRVKYLDG